MLLCIDVGNSNITFGFYKDSNIICSFRMETKETTSFKKLYEQFLIGLSQYSLIEKDIDYIMVDSVVPRIDEILKQLIVKENCKSCFVDYNSPLGINILLEKKEELGSDILVGAYQAINKYTCPCIVIDMGTATTLVVINEKKELLGGVILPGVISAFNNLINNTSLLSQASMGTPNSVIGNNTFTSLQSGMLYGTIAQINGLVEMIKEEIDMNSIQVIITGGIASFIHPYIPDAIYDENLLLDGLYNIHQNIIKKW